MQVQYVAVSEMPGFRPIPAYSSISGCAKIENKQGAALPIHCSVSLVHGENFRRSVDIGKITGKSVNASTCTREQFD